MNRSLFVLTLAAATLAASAQTPTNPSAPKSTAAKHTAAASSTSKTTGSTAPAAWIKLPAGVPKFAHGPVKTVPIVVHYEDIKIGTGDVGEAGKLWHLKYTGWRAADGVKFDSWEDHKRPVMGKDGKPELGPDKKPIMGDPQPLEIPQGIGAVIPGFDFGLTGMKIGGKRRIFIPWQLAYGTRNIPDRADHPGIPPKSDLVFDVELVGMSDMPQRPAMPFMHPGVPPHPGVSAHPGAGMPPNGAAGQHAAPAATTPAQPAKPASPAPASSTTAQPQSK